MKSGATESCFYYLAQHYKFPENVDVKRTTNEIIQSNKQYKVIWAHDNCDQAGHATLPQHVDTIDKIVCVSNWEREQYIKYNRAPAEKIVVIPNGVDDMFRPSGTPKSKTCIFFSAPHKGIAPLVPIWKEVIKHHPDAKLKVFSSMSLYGDIQPGEGENETITTDKGLEPSPFIPIYKELQALPGVEYSPCIDREELLSHIQDAAFYIHPNVWEETFCVSLAEAMSCGCFPITTDMGALPETSNRMGKYIPMSGSNTSRGWIPDNTFHQNFAEEVIRAFHFFDVARDEYEQASQAISNFAIETYSWKRIASLWQLLMNEFVPKRVKYFCMINTEKSQEYTYKALESFSRTTKLEQGDRFFLIDNDNTFHHKIKGIDLIKNQSPKSFAENANYILSQTIKDSADFVMMNNDVIFTQNWLEPLVNSNTIMVPLCNQYVIEKTDKFEISPIMDLEQYLGNEQEVEVIAKKITQQNLKFKQPNVISFHCFYLPYEISSDIGLFDEEFVIGGEDIDYRIRASQKGYETILSSLSYVLHFMGKSTWRGVESKEEIRQRNQKYYNYFVSKWGKEAAEIIKDSVEDEEIVLNKEDEEFLNEHYLRFSDILMTPYEHIDYLYQMKYEQSIGPKVIYDIGSNCLHWSKVAQMVWKNSKIYHVDGFEPFENLYKKKNVEYAIEVLSDNDHKQVTYFENFYNHGGCSYFELNYEGFPYNVAAFKNEHYREVIRKTKTLDTLVREKGWQVPDLIKMDVQGCELDIIKGAVNTIKYCPHIILELQNKEYMKGAPMRDDVINYMNFIGYRLVSHFTQNSSDADGDYHFTR